MPKKSGFNPLALPESNATLLPEPYRAEIQKRWYRWLGDHVKLTNFGVNLIRIAPGGHSAPRHAHSRQDEFVYVLEGEVELETDAGVEALRAGLVRGLSGRNRQRASLCQPIGRGCASARHRRPNRGRRGELSGH